MQTFKTQGELIAEGYEPVFAVDVDRDEFGDLTGVVFDFTQPKERRIVEQVALDNEDEAEAWLEEMVLGLDDREVDVTFWNEPDPWMEYTMTEGKAAAARWA